MRASQQCRSVFTPRERRHALALRPMGHRVAVGVVVAVGLWAPPVGAQAPRAADAATTTVTPSDPTDLSLEDLLKVEVESVFGASKSLQKVTDAPAAVSIVTAQEIERYGWRTLADVLRNVRGFYVTDDRAYAYLGTRGFLRPGDYGTRVLLTIDGHRFNDNIYDSAVVQEDFQLDLGDVERIEVIRGPSSSLYGSNAFFGVVNVVTKTSAGQARAVEGTVETGTLGLRRGLFRLRHEFANGVGVSVSGSGQDVHGVDKLYYSEFDQPESNFGVAVGRDGATRKNVFARVDYGGGSLRVGHNSRSRSLPTGAYEAVFNEPSSIRDDHTVVDGSWRRALGRGWSGLFRGAYDVYEFTGSYPYDWDGDPETPVVQYADLSTGTWWTGEAQLSRTMGRHQITAGVEYRRNNRQDQSSNLTDPYESLWDDSRQTTTAGIYVQDQFRLSRVLLLNVGLRQDRYSSFENPLKPRAALIYQPRERTSLKLLYGSAFRAPSAYEAYYITPGQWATNPDLKPEDVQTVEGILEHYVGKRLRLSAGLYRYRVERLIDFTGAANADGLLFFDNVGAARGMGFEGEVEAKWPGGLQARASYTFSDVWNTAVDEPLTNSPRHVTQGLLSVPLLMSTFLSFDVQMLSGRITRSGDVVSGYLRPSVTFSGPIRDRRMRLVLSVSNFTNQAYRDPVGDDFVQETLQQNGRTARAQLTWSF